MSFHQDFKDPLTLRTHYLLKSAHTFLTSSQTKSQKLHLNQLLLIRTCQLAPLYQVLQASAIFNLGARSQNSFKFHSLNPLDDLFYTYSVTEVVCLIKEDGRHTCVV